MYGSAKGGRAPGRQRRADNHGAQEWPIERHPEAPGVTPVGFAGGLILEVADGSTADGARVQQWEDTDSPASGGSWSRCGTPRGMGRIQTGMGMRRMRADARGPECKWPFDAVPHGPSLTWAKTARRPPGGRDMGGVCHAVATFCRPVAGPRRGQRAGNESGSRTPEPESGTGARTEPWNRSRSPNRTLEPEPEPEPNLGTGVRNRSPNRSPEPGPSSRVRRGCSGRLAAPHRPA
ncbi:RICIN domain-containing protein [Streptomyces sp. NPDC059832]|uniref:RICIN domain-containing protein n=1 Tax=Streptomyces sp. NPDC059832 TaxID=3346966 RepID=UPI003653DA52